jgi:palmitoyl-protein thioesterase
MGAISDLIQQELPGIYIYSVMVGKDASEDRNRGFLDNLLEQQLPDVCSKLKQDPKLSGGFNAVGFSQGGLFLRSYVQLCNDPPVHNLITFGSPHAGVAEVPNCQQNAGSSWSCSMARFLVQKGVYLEYVQKRVVQAQVRLGECKRQHGETK